MIRQTITNTSITLDSESGAGANSFAGFISLMCFWLAIVLVTLDVAGLSLRSFLVIADASVLILPLAFRAGLNKLDIFEPLFVTNLSLGGMMLGRPLADMVNGRYLEHSYDISTGFDGALIVVLIGNLCCQLGYFSPFTRWLAGWLPKTRTAFNVGRAALWATFLAGFGILLFAVFAVSQGGARFVLLLFAGRSNDAGAAYWESSGYIYGAIGLLVPAAIIFFGTWVLTRRLRYLFGAIVSGLPYLAVTAAQGARSGMIGLLFSVPMIWYLAKRRRPSAIRILVGVLILMSLFGFVRTHRSAKAHRAPGEEFDPVKSALSLFQSDDDEMFDVTALEVQYVPQFVSYKPLGTITDIITRAIPRQLYPDKPVDSTTVFFSAMWPSRAHATHARGGTASSLIGAFYMDSGIITVAFWMFFVGVVLGGVWRWYQNNSFSPTALLIYCVAPSVIVFMLRGTFAATIASGLFTVLPLLLLPWIERVKFSS
jgi:oligosaccharide repeat unit polymerase